MLCMNILAFFAEIFVPTFTAALVVGRRRVVPRLCPPAKAAMQGGTTMEKPYNLYTALTRAVENYNKRHHIDRGHLACAVGFVGENAAIQLSNALNPNNHDKTLNDEKKYRLLESVDDLARLVFFEEWMRQWGLKPAMMSAPTVEVCMSVLIDDAQMEADDVFKTAKMALRDEAIDEEECKDIIKEATEAMKMYEEIIRKGHVRLEKIRGGEV